MTEFCVLTAVLPDYRREFLQELQRLAPGRITFFAGQSHLVSSVRTAVPDDLYSPVSNHVFLGRRLLLQTGALRQALAARVTVVDLNPRSLTAWGVLAARGLLRRRTLVWGLLYPGRGADAPTAPVRAVMPRIADGVITYSWSQREQLRKSRPQAADRVWVAPNALYTISALRNPAGGSASRTDILFVGRLVPGKKPALLLEAFAGAIDRLPPDVRLVMVGDGSERAALERRADVSGIGARTTFLGHIGDVAKLRACYATAFCSVSPGCAGLSLTQSLGFGVPMLIADDEPHGPEIELAEEGAVTWFSAGSAADLANRLVERARAGLTPDDLLKVQATTLARYTADSMARGFLDALEGLSGDHPMLEAAR